MCKGVNMSNQEIREYIQEHLRPRAFYIVRYFPKYTIILGSIYRGPRIILAIFHQ
jgi:hypothetical protein